MDTFRIDIKSILDSLGETIQIDQPIELRPLIVGDETFTPTAPAHVSLTVTHTGSEVIAYGTVTMPAKATCVRCLCDFDLTLTGEVSGFYIEPGHEGNVPEKQEYEFVSADEHIDVMPAILESLLLEAPFAPVHDEACKGLCPTCGVDRNVEECNCADLPDDAGPFAALKGLVTSDEDTEE